MTPGDGRDIVSELRALRERLAETDAITRESAGLLSETAPKVFELEEHVAALRGTVAALVQDTEGSPAEDPAVTEAKAKLGMRREPPDPWCWPLFDVEQATAAWDALGRWVGEVLVPTYELTRGQLLDCWPRHPRLVAELSWLRHGYLEAYARGAAASKAADWHTRQLPGVLAVVALVASPHPLRLSCGPGFHATGNPETEDDYTTGARAAEPAMAEHWGAAWREAMVAAESGMLGTITYRRLPEVRAP